MSASKTAKRKQEQKTLGDRMARRRLLVEVREEAKEFAQGLRTDVDPADAVQFVLDQMTAAYFYATEKAMGLSEDEYWMDTLGGKVLHPWLREQERLGLQIVHVAGKAASMGLAERQVFLQEQQAAMFANVVDAVLRKLDIPYDTRQQIHGGIAEQLDAAANTIDGTARERVAIPVAAAA